MNSLYVVWWMKPVSNVCIHGDPFQRYGAVLMLRFFISQSQHLPLPHTQFSSLWNAFCLSLMCNSYPVVMSVCLMQDKSQMFLKCSCTFTCNSINLAINVRFFLKSVCVGVLSSSSRSLCSWPVQDTGKTFLCVYMYQMKHVLHVSWNVFTCIRKELQNTGSRSI